MDYSLLIILAAVVVGLKVLKVSIKVIGIAAIVVLAAGALHMMSII